MSVQLFAQILGPVSACTGSTTVLPHPRPSVSTYCLYSCSPNLRSSVSTYCLYSCSPKSQDHCQHILSVHPFAQIPGPLLARTICISVRPEPRPSGSSSLYASIHTLVQLADLSALSIALTRHARCCDRYQSITAPQRAAV